MRSALILPVLLALAGCTRTYAAYDETSANSLMGECERAAYDDPKVEAAVAKAAGGAGYAQQAWAQRVEDTKRQAVQRCMLQRGGGRGAGGVELPRRGGVIGGNMDPPP
jgi:hypothetical protein